MRAPPPPIRRIAFLSRRFCRACFAAAIVILYRRVYTRTRATTAMSVAAAVATSDMPINFRRDSATICRDFRLLFSLPFAMS